MIQLYKNPLKSLVSKEKYQSKFSHIVTSLVCIVIHRATMYLFENLIEYNNGKKFTANI